MGTGDHDMNQRTRRHYLAHHPVRECWHDACPDPGMCSMLGRCASAPIPADGRNNIVSTPSGRILQHMPMFKGEIGRYGVDLGDPAGDRHVEALVDAQGKVREWKDGDLWRTA